MAPDPMAEAPPATTRVEAQTPSNEPQWESPVGLGLAAAFLRTAWSVLLRPIPTFRAMTASPHIGRPFAFAVLAMVGGTLLAAVAASLTDSAGRIASDTGLLMFIMFGSLAVAMPLMFVEAGIYHVLLMILGGDRRGFAATFRVCAYVDGSTALVGWVPVLGPVVALIWGVYLRIVGLREIHRTSTSRAFASVFLAFVVPVLVIGAMLGTVVAFVLLLFSGEKIPVIEV